MRGVDRRWLGCAGNAHRAALDPRAVYYVGEFNSGASEVSIAILDQDGLAQVSPANTYVGLTTSEPGSAPGEPNRFYRAGAPNYLRVSARAFVAADRARYHTGAPDPYAIHRYEAVLGTYGFDRHGDTTLRSYGVYRVARGGALVFARDALASISHPPRCGWISPPRSSTRCTTPTGARSR